MQQHFGRLQAMFLPPGARKIGSALGDFAPQRLPVCCAADADEIVTQTTEDDNLPPSSGPGRLKNLVVGIFWSKFYKQKIAKRRQLR